MTSATDSPDTNAHWPVRVWIGYALKSLTSDGERAPFYQILGDTLIPATAQCMEPWGLTAYLPSVPGPDSDPLVPDTVTLIHYRSRAAYHQACHTSVAGRACVRLLESVFRFTPGQGEPCSHGGFTQPFTGATSLAERCYLHLPLRPVNWSKGHSFVHIAVHEGPHASEFRNALGKRLESLLESGTSSDGPDGLVMALDGPLMVMWSHWTSKARARPVVADTARIRTVMAQPSRTISVPASPLVAYEGLHVAAPSSYNVRPGFMEG